VFAAAATTAPLPAPAERGADEVPIGQQLLREADHVPVPAHRGVEQPLDTAAGKLQRPIGRKSGRTGCQQQQQHGDAEIGRAGKAAADRRAADDHRQRQQRQRRRGPKLQSGRGGERRCRPAGVEPSPTQHVDRERRGRARHDPAGGVPGKLRAGDREPGP